MNMSRVKLFFIAVVSLAFITACDNDSSSSPSPSSSPEPVLDDSPSIFELRVLHASADAPAVDVELNDEDAIEDLDYSQSSGLVNLPADTYDVSVDGISPAGANGLIEDVIDIDGQAFAGGTRYDVVAVNSVSSIEAVIVTADIDFDTSQARVSVLHAAANVPANVDVHVTAPGDTLSSATVTATVNFKEFTETPLLVPAADYQIRLTLQGSLVPVYDSGTITLNPGDDLFVAAIENTQNVSGAANKSPVALVVSSDLGSSVVYSQTDGVDLRVVHNSADAPAVDVIANDAITLVDALSFPNADGYVNAPAGTYNVKVAADADNSIVAIEVPSITFANGDVTTVVAVNKLSDLSIEPVVLQDDPRKVATHARVNVIHASTVADNLSSEGVDIYVLPASDTDITDNEPNVEDFVFKAETGYINLADGSYNIYVTLRNTKTVATSLLGANVSAGGVYLISARDTDNSFAGATIEVYVTNI